MTRLGAHVAGGPRNGYGPFCDAKPRVVLAANEGGALAEAKQKSGGHTVTIFRDTTVYLEAPGDINNPPGTYEQMAAYWYPQLKAKWEQNEADYYTISNEQGGNDLQSIRNLVAYERAVMQLANADGFKVCVLNLSTGTPGDFELWKDELAPFILEAWAAGNLYGRHVYGGEGGDLVDDAGAILPGNPMRPIEELRYLKQFGRGGIAITECGLDAGVDFAGVTRFYNQMTHYERALAPYADGIIGICMWTLGNWGAGKPNWQAASNQLATYMAANPSPAWTPPTSPPPTNGTLEEHLWQKSLEAQTISLNPDAALQSAIYKIGYVPVGSETWTAFEDKQYALQPAEHLAGLPRKVAVAEVPKWNDVRFIEEPGTEQPPGAFKLTHWPTPTKRVTQRFGANPQDYAQFGLPGHDGVDIAAKLGDAIVAAAGGTVFRIHLLGRDGYHNYGNHVRIQHQDGYRTIYAHLDAIDAGLSIDQSVAGGKFLGPAGATGNAPGGVHLHFGMKRPPGDQGWPFDLINPEPFLAPFDPIWPEGLPSQPPATGETIDLLPYLRGDGRLYEVRHADGAQERFQTQVDGNVWFQTKNAQYEEFWQAGGFIWRGLDTSPGPAPSYAERPGAPRYYRQFEQGKDGARWCRQHMKVGEIFEGPGHQVQYHYKDTCATSAANSGSAVNVVKLAARYGSRTWNGVTVNDVVEFETNTGERMWFAKGFGLVAWQGGDGSQSAISEVHKADQRPDNVRETGCLS